MAPQPQAQSPPQRQTRPSHKQPGSHQEQQQQQQQRRQPQQTPPEISAPPPAYFELEIHSPSPQDSRVLNRTTTGEGGQEVLQVTCQRKTCLRTLIWFITGTLLFILTLVLLLTLLNVSSGNGELDDVPDNKSSYFSVLSVEKKLRDIRLDLGNVIYSLTASSSTSEERSTNSKGELDNLNQSIVLTSKFFENVENGLKKHMDSAKDFWTEESRVLNSSQDMLKKIVAAHHPQTERRSCQDIKRQSLNSSSGSLLLSKQIIYPLGKGRPVEVLCDFETDGGGWTIIQRRTGGPKAQFYRDWIDYEQGFSSPDRLHGSYWLGLKSIWALTSEDTDGGPQTLRIELTDWDDNTAWAEYSSFSLSSPQDSYRLMVSGYSGDAGDALSYHHFSKFSTRDSDNDEDMRVNCAEDRHAGWWFKSCSKANLNGFYWGPNVQVPTGDGIVWYNWRGSDQPLKHVQMKIRRAV